MIDANAPARARDADVSQPPLFLESLEAILLQRTRMGKQTFLPTRQEHDVELEPLGRMQGHDRNSRPLFFALDLDDQGNMFEELGQRREAAERTHEFLQVLEPAARLLRPLGLPHRDKAALLDDCLRELLRRKRIDEPAPTREIADEALSALRALGFSAFVSTRSRAACMSGMRFSRACRESAANVVSPRPRLGVL